MDRRGVLAGGLLGLASPASAASQGSAGATSGAAGDLPARFAAALNAHDIDAFAALFAEDYINHQTSAATPPPAAPVRPKEASVAFFRQRLIGLPDLRVIVEASLAQGALCAASFVYEGTHQGPYFGVPPTGRSLRFTSCDIFRVEGGLIAEHWGMGDAAGIVAQLRR